MDQHITETSQLYKGIIGDVINKLKRNSDKGQLQMSESEIQTFQSFWCSCLEDIQNGKQQITKEEPIQQVQTIEQDPLPYKKVKQYQQEVKKEEDADGDDVAFSDDSSSSNDAKVEQINQYIQQTQQRYEQFNTNKYEQQREKTLFDKIRELEENLKNKTKQEDGEEEEETEDPKIFEAQIFAQKTNMENIVSRIRPNKLQKAGLEQVLIRDKNNKECLIAQASLSFNFKTSNNSKKR